MAILTEDKKENHAQLEASYAHCYYISIKFDLTFPEKQIKGVKKALIFNTLHFKHKCEII